MNAHRERAVVMLIHYITLLMEKAGLRVDSDTHVELEECVDEIIAAAVQEVVHNEHFGLDARLVEMTRRLDTHEQQMRIRLGERR